MAEAAVVGEVLYRAAVINENVKVGKGAEHRTRQQGLAPLTGWCDGSATPAPSAAWVRESMVNAVARGTPSRSVITSW